MEKKYTQGPWFVKDGFGLNIWGGEEITAPLLAVGLLKNTKTVKEAEANAHLIAAAPELLESLEKHCKRCEKKKLLFDAMNGSETLKYSCEICSTRDAIAKAYSDA